MGKNTNIYWGPLIKILRQARNFEYLLCLCFISRKFEKKLEVLFIQLVPLFAFVLKQKVFCTTRAVVNVRGFNKRL